MDTLPNSLAAAPSTPTGDAGAGQGTMPTAPATAPGRTILLRGGRVATVRREPTGDDLLKASVAAGGAGDIAVSMALVAAVVEVDGQRVVYEDLKAMRAVDVLLLLGAVLGNDPSPGPETSSG